MRRLPKSATAFSVARAEEVPAPPEIVYALLAEPAQRPEWMTELKRIEAQDTGRPVEVGDRFEGVSSILFHDFIGLSEVTVAEPPTRLDEDVVIGARFTSSWELTETADGGTRVHHVLAVQFPGGPFSWIERFVLRRRLERMQRQSLMNLARRWAAR